jgi:hypothetical protein
MTTWAPVGYHFNPRYSFSPDYQWPDRKLFANCFYVCWRDVEHEIDTNGVDKIKKMSQQKPVLVAAEDVPDLARIDTISQKIKEHDLQNHITLLIEDPVAAKKHKDLGFRWFNANLLRTSVNNAGNRLPNWQHRQFRLSCLSKTPRLHRLRLWYLMHQRPWGKDVFKSLSSIRFGEWLNLENASDIKNLYAQLGHNVTDWLLAHEHELPYSSEVGYDFWNNCMSSASPAYLDCYFNVTSESEIYHFHCTEKSVKPLIAGNIPIFFNAPGVMQMLTSIGFDLEFAGVNQPGESSDSCDKRCLAIVDEIDRVWADIPDIWQANLSRIKHNRDFSISDKLREICIQDVKEFVTY